MVGDRNVGENAVYQIRVRGIIGQQWSAWFDSLEIVPLENGEMLLVGPVVDQAALHGILYKIHSLNLSLLSITRIDHPPSHQTG